MLATELASLLAGSGLLAFVRGQDLDFHAAVAGAVQAKPIARPNRKQSLGASMSAM
jgi:hypothetical protein